MVDETSNTKNKESLPVVAQEQILPVEVSAELQRKTKYTETYLNNYLTRYNLDAQELQALVKWHDDYGIDLPHIAQLRDKGYLLIQIEEFLSARENLTLKEEYSGGTKHIKERPSLASLIELSSTFNDVEIDSDSIYEWVRTISETIPKKHLGQSIQTAIRIAERLGSNSLERVLEHAEFMRRVLNGEVDKKGLSYPPMYERDKRDYS